MSNFWISNLSLPPPPRDKLCFEMCIRYQNKGKKDLQDLIGVQIFLGLRKTGKKTHSKKNPLKLAGIKHTFFVPRQAHALERWATGHRGNFFQRL